MDSDDKKPGLPAWWMDGSGPLAIGVAGAVIAAVMVALRTGTALPDGFGTLIVTALVANGIALDNCRDGDPKLRAIYSRAAVCALVVTLLAAGFALRR